MTGEVELVGYAPIVTIGVAPPITEQRKYQRMWEREEYRRIAPGEQLAHLFIHTVHPERDATLIDFGAGTGRGALLIAALTGTRVTMLDFAPNCLDESVLEAMRGQVPVTSGEPHLQFKQHDLTHPIPYKAKYGYCTDVMEHIPTADVDKVLHNILLAAENVYFQISCVDDSCGKLIGHPLHLTVQPHAWWMQKFQQFGCLVHQSFDHKDSCIFYVSAWQDAKRFVETGVLNTSEEACLENMRANLTRGLPEVRPYEQNDFEVVLLAGGPSLNDHVEEIKALRAGGAKLVTVNNTYHWALGHGLIPSAQVMVDAREHNKRFVQPRYECVKYLMASQVHPTVLDSLLDPLDSSAPVPQVLLWHTGMASSIPLLDERKLPYYVIPTGSSVVLRALSLFLMLGYHKFHVFGFDSSLRDDVHHAYEQKENDGQATIPVTCGTKVFACHPWMVSQAQEFQDLVRLIGDHIDMHVYGDGLIAEIINTGAALVVQNEFAME